MATQVPVRRQCLDQPLERKLLVLDRVERAAMHAADQLLEAWRARQVVAKDDGVDERPDYLLQLGPGAGVDRRSYDHVVLVRVPVEQNVERGEHRAEERRPLGTRKSPQPLAQRAR